MKTCLHYLFCLVTAVFTLLSLQTQANDLAPSGYSWYACQKVKCHFLVPDGWQVRELKNNGIIKFRLAPRTANRKLSREIRINVLVNAQRRTGLSSERYAELFRQTLKRTGKLLNIWDHQAGVLNSTAAISVYGAQASVAQQKFNMLIRNKATGTLYVFTFHTQPKYWQRDWPVVKQIFTRLRLDEGV